MGVNVKCPKCGSTKVQLSNEMSKHGCLWTVLFGLYYFVWIMMKWCIGLMIFICYDWWMAIIKKSSGKGHVWQSKRWFSNRRRIFFCHDCGHNFRAQSLPTLLYICLLIFLKNYTFQGVKSTKIVRSENLLQFSDTYK